MCKVKNVYLHHIVNFFFILVWARFNYQTVKIWLKPVKDKRMILSTLTFKNKTQFSQKHFSSKIIYINKIIIKINFNLIKVKSFLKF